MSHEGPSGLTSPERGDYGATSTERGDYGATSPERGDYGATSADRKPRVILTLNEIYDKIGFGNAQIFYWTVLCMISVSDTIEQVLIALIIPYLKCEWELTLVFEGAITTSIFVFYGISGVIFGKVADRYGRKTVLTYTLIVLGITAVCSAVAQNKWQFLAARSVTGACIGANFAAIVSYSTEVVESRRRAFAVSLIIFISKVGMFLTAVAGFLLLNVIGWRWFIIVVSFPIIPSLILLQFLPESPRYLVASGKKKEVKKAILKMAEWNNVEIDDDIEVVCYESEDLGHISVLFEPTYKRETILLSIIYFGNILIFLGLVLFLPMAFNSDFCGGTGETPKHQCKKISQSSLGKVVVVVSATMIGLVAAHFISNIVGRAVSLKIFSGGVLLASLVLYKCFNETVTMIVLFCIQFFASGLNVLVWIIILENYPTIVRTTASGFINLWGKIGGVMGVLGVYLFFYFSPYLVVTQFVLASLCSFIGSMLFSKETKDVVVSDVRSGG